MSTPRLIFRKRGVLLSSQNGKRPTDFPDHKALENFFASALDFEVSAVLLLHPDSTGNGQLCGSEKTCGGSVKRIMF
ncbi:hypothetical protein [Hymenobacter latericus]|uniref:hypothetical protein n=1 Tax=Hymenobacter sp. YIM 151858-1 TaxID=2987688 RepID=UPI0022268F5D|nr:hypothetical protein [Hymenobacter sp. YIM 151858-1]UYZ59434.1 hypothetical protein OIS50_01210 [Hymenobacter sp. YIM 151858-1]